MTGKPTIHDVAERAGVSIATVSRALRDVPTVSPRTSARVKAAADDLGYQPNRLAAGLRLSSTSTIGMVVPSIANPYYAALVEAVVRVLEPTGRELLLNDSLDDATVERSRVAALLGRQIDGLIIVPCDRRLSGQAVAAAAAAVPTVQLDRVADGVDTDLVVGDDDLGIREVIGSLGETSPERLHFISATGASSAGQSRIDAFHRATGNHVPAANEHLGEFSTAWGRKAVQELLAAGESPAAIVCGADVIALGVLRALREAGLEVPDDVVVTGYDDIAFADLATPRLTTVRQPVRELAVAAVTRLDARAESPGSPTQRTLIRPSLVVRETTR